MRYGRGEGKLQNKQVVVPSGMALSGFKRLPPESDPPGCHYWRTLLILQLDPQFGDSHRTMSTWKIIFRVTLLVLVCVFLPYWLQNDSVWSMNNLGLSTETGAVQRNKNTYIHTYILIYIHTYIHTSIQKKNNKIITIIINIIVVWYLIAFTAGKWYFAVIRVTLSSSLWNSTIYQVILFCTLIASQRTI